MLQPEFDVIATVANGVALLAKVDGLSPDVIVTDISMPGLDGIAAASEILRKIRRLELCSLPSTTRPSWSRKAWLWAYWVTC